MASAQLVALPLPLLPEGWSAERDFKAAGSLSSATQREIEPVGRWFLAHARRVRLKSSYGLDGTDPNCRNVTIAPSRKMREYRRKRMSRRLRTTMMERSANLKIH